MKMMGTLALALILLGLMAWRAPAGGAFARFLPLPSSSHRYEVFGRDRELDADASRSRSRSCSPSVTTAFLRYTKLGTAIAGDSPNDREITATLGVPVRRVEAVGVVRLGPRRAAPPGCCCRTSSPRSTTRR